ncbi:helix-turn-helix domain-containing protein [Cochlodiniinecator piscidefendens]|uniref:helix-turn-helix domain-containing protein n=1 Tax=Cochlodiniinecator piscidefendens TaxID=2715756 RepID=UPI00140C89AF|nr:XRE family transcriptional regulator [Cochlodiniinecator piscidefendens]
MSERTEINDRLALRLKEARQALGLSLEAVSKLSGVSRSMVSQIERGESSPTVATLWNLTRALQVDFAGLLETGPTERIEVLRAGDVPTIAQHGKGCHIRILSPPEDAGKSELYDLQFDDAGELNSQPHSQGAMETLSVVVGTVRVTSGALSEVLHKGDTARYAADCPHKIEAVGGIAQALLIVKNG